MQNIKIIEAIEESIKAKKGLNPEAIGEAAKIISGTLKDGGKVLIAGNGGSAADSQHFAAELIGRFMKERRSLPAIALTTDTSVLTAWSNDYSFDSLFERQLEGIGAKGDIFIGISTSGNSKNIILAIQKAKRMGIKTVCLLGKDGGKLKGMSDAEIIVRHNETPRIQEAHITALHIIAGIIEEEIS